MQRTYKRNIVDFIEGRMPPAEFEAWFESTPAALDWLQSLIPEGMTMDDCVEVTMDYFLKKLPVNEYEEIMAAYRALCEAKGAPIEAQIPLALEVVRLLSAVDPKKVRFDSIIPILLPNFDLVLHYPASYKPDYVAHMVDGVRTLFTREYRSVGTFPYDVRRMAERQKTTTRLGYQLNLQGWLYWLMEQLFPEEIFVRDNTLSEKHSFLLDACPEYIGGVEVEEAGIIEDILDSVPETLPKTKRIKEVKSRIKEAFHVSGIIYPRWVQEAEWPVSPSGKPMRFVKQKRKKGKEYENMLYTLFYFEDVDTGEERIVEQFT
ncbi:MAG: hypothetical protein E7610_10390 [Ruminococcaceae bacterium]|nr:hypothetical protein [Oscillospiraceae bacterium]